MIICVSNVRNEEKYLPGFFSHINKFVDAFVFLDDGSTDNTAKIIQNEKKVRTILKNPPRESRDYEDGLNHARIVDEAYRLGAEWILCADADERFELRFLENLKNLTEHYNTIGKKLIGLHFRELWDYSFKYRCDGIWNIKQKYILFKPCENMEHDLRQHHSLWYPLQYEEEKYMMMSEYNLYHLRMIKQSSREERKNKFNQLDPNKELQAIGYDYLTDPANLQLQEINLINKYDFSSIPKDLKYSNLSVIDKLKKRKLFR